MRDDRLPLGRKGTSQNPVEISDEEDESLAVEKPKDKKRIARIACECYKTAAT